MAGYLKALLLLLAFVLSSTVRGDDKTMVTNAIKQLVDSKTLILNNMLNSLYKTILEAVYPTISRNIDRQVERQRVMENVLQRLVNRYKNCRLDVDEKRCKLKLAPKIKEYTKKADGLLVEVTTKIRAEVDDFRDHVAVCSGKRKSTKSNNLAKYGTTVFSNSTLSGSERSDLLKILSRANSLISSAKQKFEL